MLDRLVAWSEGLDSLACLRANAFIGVLAVLANGGVLALYAFGRADELASWIAVIAVVVVLDAVLVGLSVAGLRSERWERPALRLGAVVMSGLAGTLLVCATWWSVMGLPSEFRWRSPGLLTALVTYAGALARRALLSPRTGAAVGVRNGHRRLVGWAIVADVGMVIRILLTMA